MGKQKELDIHNIKRKLKNQVKKLDTGISRKNKEIILEFDKHCFLKEQLSISRRCKLICVMYNFCKKYLRKDLDKADVKDLENAINEIQSRDDYSVWTKQNYNTIVKKFYRWLYLLRENGNNIQKGEYPPICSWIPTTIRKKNIPKVKPNEILTEDEVAKLLEFSTHPRTRALIFMLYEGGLRVSECGNLRVKDLTKTEYGYLVSVEGKTGSRTPEFINCVPALNKWLSVHPLVEKIKNGENPPLWVNIDGKNTGKHMDYGTIRMMIKRIARKSGIKRRIWNHLFRHSRVTHVLVNGLMTETQAKKYFGWCPSSKQLETYTHLQSADTNNAYKKSLGLIKDDDKENGRRFNKKICKICDQENLHSDIYCVKCGKALDLVTAQRDAVKRQEEKEKELKSLQEQINEMKDNFQRIEKLFLLRKKMITRNSWTS